MLIILVAGLYLALNFELWRQERLCWPQVRVVFFDENKKPSYNANFERKENYYRTFYKEPYYYIVKGKWYKGQHKNAADQMTAGKESIEAMRSILKESQGKARFNPNNPKESYLIIEGSTFGWPQFILTIVFMILMLGVALAM